MGIRPELWPREGGKYSSAVFTMSNAQKDIFLKTLQHVIFPDGYSSNITRCVDLRQRKLYGLKSHDCHVLMEHLLPMLVKNALPANIGTVIANLSSFFRALCGKAVNPLQLDELQNHVPMESTEYSSEIQCLACGPRLQARRYRAYNVNGYKFRIMAKDEGMKTQNSGVYVSSNTRSYASMRDQKVAIDSVPYYGKIVDIIELNYSCQFSVVLFKCIWADTITTRGIKQDHLGLTSVNFSRSIHTGDQKDDEPYILASEAPLVYYVDDEVDKEWSIVVHVKPRDLYDMGEENEEAEVGFSPQPGLNMSTIENIGELQLTRDDIQKTQQTMFLKILMMLQNET
ncbi:hypothetical protein AHAS_Ahas16G0154100 [Arachis hypogaea]